MPFYGHFEIDIITALSQQLVEAFSKLESGAFNLANINSIPANHQGVYELFLDGALVYVGQAKRLRQRVAQHHFKIRGRRNISPERMGFRCVSVHRNWTALSPETALIRHYRGDPNACAWNGNGFGPHDPGRNRETTNKSPIGFDVQYPIRDDWSVEGIAAGAHNGNALLRSVKEQLPYLLRYQTSNRSQWKQGHPDYNDLTIDLPKAAMPAQQLLIGIAQQLPPGWQLTRFPGHFILYKEQRGYAHGTVLWPTA
jgi:hypothetical protein